MKSKIVGEISPEEFGRRQLQATPQEDVLRKKLKHEQREAADAIKRYDTLLDRIAHEDRIIEDHASAVREALGNNFQIVIPPHVPKKNNSKKTPESAVAIFSDSHIWKIVERSETLEFGHYNPKVFLDRLSYLEETIIRLLTQNIDNPIRKLYIMFLGDIVEGMLNHAQELPQRGHMSDQVLFASFVIYQFVARLAQVVDVECYAIAGNHGRWPSQKKMPTEGRFSNFDMIAMGQVAQLLKAAGPKNVKFNINDQPFQIVDIEGYRFKLGHGDHLKGGDKAVGVPSHAIGREVSATTAQFASRGLKVPDYYIVGDKHRHMSVSTATGRYYVNGAFFSVDSYSTMANFPPCQPFQMFFGVHPKFGRSWEYDIALHLAKPRPIQYDIPEHLLRKVQTFAS